MMKKSPLGNSETMYQMKDDSGELESLKKAEDTPIQLRTIPKGKKNSLIKVDDDDLINPQEFIKVLQDAHKEISSSNIKNGRNLRKSIAELNRMSINEIRRLSKMSNPSGSFGGANEKTIRFENDDKRRESAKEIMVEDLKRYNTIMKPRVTNLRDNIKQSSEQVGKGESKNKLNEGIYKYLEELESKKMEMLKKRSFFRKFKDFFCCRRNEFAFIQKELKVKKKENN